MSELEFATILLMLCFVLLLGIAVVYCADCLVEARKVKLLEGLSESIANDAKALLVQDYQNLQEWMDQAEKMRFQLEILEEETELLRHTRSKLQSRDKLGRFSKVN